MSKSFSSQITKAADKVADAFEEEVRRELIDAQSGPDPTSVRYLVDAKGAASIVVSAGKSGETVDGWIAATRRDLVDAFTQLKDYPDPDSFDPLLHALQHNDIVTPKHEDTYDGVHSVKEAIVDSWRGDLRDTLVGHNVSKKDRHAGGYLGRLQTAMVGSQYAMGTLYDLTLASQQIADNYQKAMLDLADDSVHAFQDILRHAVADAKATEKNNLFKIVNAAMKLGSLLPGPGVSTVATITGIFDADALEKDLHEIKTDYGLSGLRVVDVLNNVLKAVEDIHTTLFVGEMEVRNKAIDAQKNLEDARGDCEVTCPSWDGKVDGFTHA